MGHRGSVRYILLSFDREVLLVFVNCNTVFSIKILNRKIASMKPTNVVSMDFTSDEAMEELKKRLKKKGSIMISPMALAISACGGGGSNSVSSINTSTNTVDNQTDPGTIFSNSQSLNKFDYIYTDVGTNYLPTETMDFEHDQCSTLQIF